MSLAIMDKGEVFTPISEMRKKTEQVVVPPQVQEAAKRVVDPEKAKRIGQVHFKARHGIIVAFFTFIL